MSQLEGHFYRNGLRNVNEAHDLIYKCISVKYRLINHALARENNANIYIYGVSFYFKNYTFSPK